MANCENCENYAPKSTTACENYAEKLQQLKSCPFCGGEAITKASVTKGLTMNMITVKIGCYDCDVWKYDGIKSGGSFEELNKAMQDVISKWNRRAGNE